MLVYPCPRPGRPLAIVVVLLASVLLFVPALAQQPPPYAPAWPSQARPAALAQLPEAPLPAAAVPAPAPEPAAPAIVPPQPIAPPPAALPAQGGQPGQPPSILYRVQGAAERLEMVVGTSRILTLDKRIPQAQVNNPDILDLVPLSPNQVQVSAKKPGVTQVNLWSEDKKIHTIDVMVLGDARELAAILRQQFPKAALNVVPVGNSVLISGYVDQQELIPRITRIAEEYYPKIINNMTVSGAQQILLHVRVMEVSRTKLRAFGFDWSNISGQSVIRSNPSGLLTGVTPGTPGTAPVLDPISGAVLAPGAAATAATGATSGAETIFFGIVHGANAFFGVLEAMRKDNLMKVLAEPNLVAISGRPSYIQAGGEYGYQLSSGMSGPSAAFKEYGTRVDMVPIVLGNGRIRLEVRPSVSEIDKTLSVNGIPALKTRVVDTAVELRSGQTFAIAGLVQHDVEAENKGLPWISEVPYLGMAFRRVEEKTNEIELLILVTPEFAEPMDACQVPPCGPGSETESPSDCELYFKGHLEVPRCCPACNGSGCATCAGSGHMQPSGNGTLVQSGNPRRPQTPSNPNGPGPAAPRNPDPGFIGPIGYDVVK